MDDSGFSAEAMMTTVFNQSGGLAGSTPESPVVPSLPAATAGTPATARGWLTGCGSQDVCFAGLSSSRCKQTVDSLAGAR